MSKICLNCKKPLDGKHDHKPECGDYYHSLRVFIDEVLRLPANRNVNEA